MGDLREFSKNGIFPKGEHENAASPLESESEVFEMRENFPVDGITAYVNADGNITAFEYTAEYLSGEYAGLKVAVPDMTPELFENEMIKKIKQYYSYRNDMDTYMAVQAGHPYPEDFDVDAAVFSIVDDLFETDRLKDRFEFEQNAKEIAGEDTDIQVHYPRRGWAMWRNENGGIVFLQERRDKPKVISSNIVNRADALKARFKSERAFHLFLLSFVGITGLASSKKRKMNNRINEALNLSDSEFKEKEEESLEAAQQEDRPQRETPAGAVNIHILAKRRKEEQENGQREEDTGASAAASSVGRAPSHLAALGDPGNDVGHSAESDVAQLLDGLNPDTVTPEGYGEDIPDLPADEPINSLEDRFDFTDNEDVLAVLRQGDKKSEQKKDTVPAGLHLGIPGEDGAAAKEREDRRMGGLNPDTVTPEGYGEGKSGAPSEEDLDLTDNNLVLDLLDRIGDKSPKKQDRVPPGLHPGILGKYDAADKAEEDRSFPLTRLEPTRYAAEAVAVAVPPPVELEAVVEGEILVDVAEIVDRELRDEHTETGVKLSEISLTEAFESLGIDREAIPALEALFKPVDFALPEDKEEAKHIRRWRDMARKYITAFVDSGIPIDTLPCVLTQLFVETIANNSDFKIDAEALHRECGVLVEWMKQAYIQPQILQLGCVREGDSMVDFAGEQQNLKNAQSNGAGVVVLDSHPHAGTIKNVENLIKAVAVSMNVLHVASHGQRGSEKERGGLRLVKDHERGDDGILGAEELLDILGEVGAELEVYLATACEQVEEVQAMVAGKEVNGEHVSVRIGIGGKGKLPDEYGREFGSKFPVELAMGQHPFAAFVRVYLSAALGIKDDRFEHFGEMIVLDRKDDNDIDRRDDSRSDFLNKWGLDPDAVLSNKPVHTYRIDFDATFLAQHAKLADRIEQAFLQEDRHVRRAGSGKKVNWKEGALVFVCHKEDTELVRSINRFIAESKTALQAIGAKIVSC